ncbi:PREDICTED: histone H4-like [Crocodylus porosus]|uniref:histone H4-like n=1 Tax=Crocodylus porosus TaxID=8502 RepID=UPI00093AEB56|nr:PREDICTED: histone H4-like [Crocodylus porosus]
MSGRGKGGKGQWKGSAKCYHKVLCHIQRITKPAGHHLAGCGGMEHISSLISEETCRVLKVFLESMVHDTVTYPEQAKHKTVTVVDVVYPLVQIQWLNSQYQHSVSHSGREWMPKAIVSCV